MTTLSQFTGAIRSPSVQTTNDIGLHTITVTLSDGTTAERKDIELASGETACGYIIADAIRTLKGELQLDIEGGIDYDNTVWASRKNVSKWIRLVKRKILSYSFVSNIISFDATVLNEGVLDYKMCVKTSEGKTISIYS